MTVLTRARLGVALATLAIVTTTGQEAMTAARAPALAAPTGLTATPGNQQVTVAWQASAGAASYTVYRRVATESSLVPIASNVTTLTFTNTGLTNGLRYYYRVRAVAGSVVSRQSERVDATPTAPPPTVAPTNLLATPGNARVALSWQGVPDATGYRVYRSTTGTFSTTPLSSVTTTSFTDTSVVNGTSYQYAVSGYNAGGNGPVSAVVTATPLAPPAAPTGVSGTPGDGEVTVSWTASSGATTYSVYRGTAAGNEGPTPVTSLAASPFVDTGRTNGVAYFYVVTARNTAGESQRSTEVSATPQGPAPPTDLDTLAAFRFLRQATWGPKPGGVERLKTDGISAFFVEQLGAAPSPYPDSLLTQSVESSQEHFMQNAMEGPDQLRQRMAWTLHKMWVVSAVELDCAPAMLGYYRLLMNDAFGNYRTLMRDMTLNPAMGRYLNMLNNVSQTVTGVPPNENYPRELMQLFTLGLVQLNPNGTPMLDPVTGLQKPPTYTEADVKALARILTGWTFGDGNSTPPTDFGDENYLVPMEPVAAYHDTGEKMFLGVRFDAGQSATAELDHALQVIFDHPNVGPFVARQLIQQLVTSNPSPAYIGAVAGAFADNGGGVRGDLTAVVRAVLTHTEAGATSATSGKLSEPVLFVLSQLRALDASITDHPFMSDKTAEMGQKVFYPPSVFSYFSPGFRVRNTGTPSLVGPEFQQYTTVTSLIRANFVSSLLGGYFGSAVTVDYSAFTSRAANAATLVDYTSGLVLGGRLSAQERTEIIGAVSVMPATEPLERAHTALYLMLVLAQNQVDR